MLELLVQFPFALAWVCFVSWVIARFAFHEAEPLRRAALTALTSWFVAAALSSLTLLALGRASLTPFLLFILPSAVDFLLLWRAFGKSWINDGDVAHTFE